MSDPNGVPFTVAPVRSDDPAKKKEEDKKEQGEANGVDEAKGSGKVDGKDKDKDEEEELVGGIARACCIHRDC